MTQSELITPDQVPLWIPGTLTMDSASLPWDGMTLKGYEYTAQGVEIPLMRDYMIVRYWNTPAEMCRRSKSPWESAQVGPGKVSILTRAEKSEWRWNGPLRVSHLYLEHEALNNVACDVFERDVKDVEIRDLLSAENSTLSNLIGRLEWELTNEEVGGRLYADLLRNQACIEVLRKYASISYKENTGYGRFSPTQRRILLEYIEQNIAEDLSLQDLASTVNLSIYYFTKKFRSEFGCTPHFYVIMKRLNHAKRLLRRQDVPIKAVAAEAGFSDQSHMTRLFRRFLSVTPAEFRMAS